MQFWILDTQNLQQVPNIKKLLLFFEICILMKNEPRQKIIFAYLSISLHIENDTKSTESVPAIIFWGDVRY